MQTLADALVEGNEMFQASLSIVDGQIMLEDSTATATILDNNGQSVEG